MGTTDVDSNEILRDLVVGREFGMVRVLDATVSSGEDSAGDRAFYLRLTLTDPDDDTWPPDDLYEMRQSVRADATRLGIAEMVYFSLWPEHPAPLAADVPASGGA